MEIYPRRIRPALDPLGLYIHSGYNDQRVMLGLLAENQLSATGIILDASFKDRQQELLTELLHQEKRVILDPCTVELATEQGFTRKRKLPWASARPHEPRDLSGYSGEAFLDSIVEFIVENGFNAVLAPTHYVSERNPEWLNVDIALTRDLRARLEDAKLDLPIYYPLVIQGTLFRQPRFRESLLTKLKELDIDSLWLRVHPFGSRSGPMALRGYMEACRDLHSLRIPIVAERSGSIGLALLGFGAVGGIEGGVTIREHFDIKPLLQQRKGKPFGVQPRVYIPGLGSFFTKDRATEFFEGRGMKAKFGCQTPGCCQRGFRDMLEKPGRHFLIQRTSEVARLSRVPEQLRSENYLDDFLRPATDSMIAAIRFEPKLRNSKDRLESWRVMLSEMARSAKTRPFSRSTPARGNRISHRKSA